METKKMSSFLNTRPNLMNLRFGCDKCEKMRVSTTINKDICQWLTIDLWEEYHETDESGKTDLLDIYKGNSYERSRR